jgi:RNA polymerase sigma-70 factor (sigma-E family)
MDAEMEQEFRAFVEARAQVLFRSALALTGHRQQAEDLLQTTLAKGAQHWSRIRENNPEAYLRKALYREQISWWRSRRRGREISVDQLPELAVADATEQVDVRMAVRQALGRLAPRHRAVLVLRYLEDRPDDEIAEILDCTESTVRSQIVRALARLRALGPELAPTVAEGVWDQ